MNRNEENLNSKKIILEKEFEELLQMSQQEKNKAKKNKLRQYMENIAKTIKSIH